MAGSCWLARVLMTDIVRLIKPSSLGGPAVLASRGDHEHGGTRLVLHEVPQQLKAVLQILGWDTTPGLALQDRDQQCPSAFRADRTLTAAGQPDILQQGSRFRRRVAGGSTQI